MVASTAVVPIWFSNASTLVLSAPAKVTVNVVAEVISTFEALVRV